MAGSYEVFVRLWRQDGQPLPGIVWPELLNTFDRRGPMESIAEILAKRLPPEVSWRVSVFPPSPVGLSSLGGERLSSIVMPIEQVIDSGAVLYDPKTKRYSLNVRKKDSGLELAVPIDIEVVEARGLAPFDIPGVPALPLHPSWRSEVLKVWHTTLSGAIDSRLVYAINRAINQGPLCKEWWYLHGHQIAAIVKWRVRFALPGSLAREGTQRLPKNWASLAANLIPTEQAPEQTVRSHFFGIKGGLGVFHAAAQFYRQNITLNPALNPHSLPTLPRLGFEELNHTAQPLPTLIFVPGTDHSRPQIVTMPIDAEPENTRASLEKSRVEPSAVISLVFPDARQTGISLKGVVLNALHGHPVAADELPIITQFLRNLDSAASGRGRSNRGRLSWNAALIHQVLSNYVPGQALPQESIDAIYHGIQKFYQSLPSAPSMLNLPGS
jgi:hypothetical protein